MNWKSFQSLFLKAVSQGNLPDLIEKSAEMIHVLVEARGSLKNVVEDKKHTVVYRFSFNISFLFRCTLLQLATLAAGEPGSSRLVGDKNNHPIKGKKAHFNR